MSGLHQAVAHAIAANAHALFTDAEGGTGQRHDWDEAAAAAIRVVLAEATRSIEALPAYKGMQARPHERMLYAPDVLAALAALAEEQA